MSLDWRQQLEHLAQKDPEMRRTAMEQALRETHLPYTVQRAKPDSKRLHMAENFLVKTGEQDKPCVLLCAHYDAVPGSAGANDNAAAVCILLELAHALAARGETFEFAFFDAEEDGRAGSKLYVKELERGSVTGVINLDLCGYGDTVVVLDKGHVKKPALSGLCNGDIMQRHSAQFVKYLPESDDVSFRGSQVPHTSIAVIPRWDIQFLNALSTYGGSFISRPPEFDMITGQMEVSTTMHGGFRDTAQSVQTEAMQLVYDYLYEALTAAPVEKRGFFSR